MHAFFQLNVIYKLWLEILFIIWTFYCCDVEVQHIFKFISL